jgi:2-hydroxychromene-2-carboxylate isomerase
VSPEQPVFYYDLGSPACYLAAERVMTALPVVPEWEPILGSALGLPAPELDGTRWEQLAADQGLQALKLPAAWPPDTTKAMLAAAYAKQIGRAVAFSLAAFRQAFAGGRDLGDTDTVLLAAAACEIHPTAVIRALELRSVSDALDRACARARAAGVRALPAVQVGDEVFAGENGIETAAQALRGRS